MPDWSALLHLPNDVSALGRIVIWFGAIAERLLNETELRVAQQSYRLVEIEFYLHNANHPDPFTHRHPIQFQCGRWYFHRSGSTYRGGSFKGLDLTFGDGTATGGILLRSLATPEGRILCGPSLCVDHLLHTLGMERVAELDRVLDGRLVWDADSPLSLRHVEPVEKRVLLSSPRVGLSLKKARVGDERPRYLMRPYRYLSEPRKVSKGKRLAGQPFSSVGHVVGVNF